MSEYYAQKQVKGVSSLRQTVDVFTKYFLFILILTLYMVAI